jgi:hypothetical protein
MFGTYAIPSSSPETTFADQFRRPLCFNWLFCFQSLFYWCLTSEPSSARLLCRLRGYFPQLASTEKAGGNASKEHGSAACAGYFPGRQHCGHFPWRVLLSLVHAECFLRQMRFAWGQRRALSTFSVSTAWSLTTACLDVTFARLGSSRMGAQ